jgi:transcriptional regulator GlxA family with amidase domain
MTQPIASLFFDTGNVTGTQAWPREEAMRLLDDVRRAMARSRADTRAAALRLVCLLDRQAAQPVESRGGLAPWQARKIQRHITDHLIEPLRVQELAEQVSLSASYFHHAFKETFGTSPHAYIRKIRIESAKSMMLSTNEPLSQIAVACGFADQPHLCKIFRRALKESPAAWRRRNRAGPATADPDSAPSRVVAAGSSVRLQESVRLPVT